MYQFYFIFFIERQHTTFQYQTKKTDNFLYLDLEEGCVNNTNSRVEKNR
jgi:hypothetical protein